MMKKKNLSHTCANRKDLGLYITRTDPYLQTIMVLQCCRLFLKQGIETYHHLPIDLIPRFPLLSRMYVSGHANYEHMPV